jgi:hypothetical protein
VQVAEVYGLRKPTENPFGHVIRHKTACSQKTRSGTVKSLFCLKGQNPFLEDL